MLCHPQINWRTCRPWLSLWTSMRKQQFGQLCAYHDAAYPATTSNSAAILGSKRLTTQLKCWPWLYFCRPSKLRVNIDVTDYHITLYYTVHFAVPYMYILLVNWMFQRPFRCTKVVGWTSCRQDANNGLVVFTLARRISFAPVGEPKAGFGGIVSQKMNLSRKNGEEQIQCRFSKVRKVLLNFVAHFLQWNKDDEPGKIQWCWVAIQWQCWLPSSSMVHDISEYSA